jgi:ribosomal protein L7Ae-like RNA K-turn-binding protein
MLEHKRGSQANLDDTSEDEDALTGLQSAKFGTGGAATLQARVRWWSLRAEARGIAAFPLEPESLKLAAALLRKGSYRSGTLYLSAAKRARKLQVGSDAACMSLRAGEASLVIVAGDAAAAAERTEVRAAVREGAAIAWGTKARLGALLRPALEDSAPEVGVVAVTDTRIASAIRETRTVIDSVAQSPQGPQRHGEFRQDSPAIRHASILNEGTATLSPPALPGSGTEEPPLGSAE